MYEEILFAGFGGQGIIFAGRLLAEGALEEGWEVACTVSYGPEMRGGTANATVVISDHPVSSLVVTRPTIAVIMNTLSLAKFEPNIATGGLLIADQSLTPSRRSDIQAYYVPACSLAQEMGRPTVANIILLGALLAVKPVVAPNTIRLVLRRMFPPDQTELVQSNEHALELGLSKGVTQEVR